MEYTEFELAFFQEGEVLSDTNENKQGESEHEPTWIMRVLRKLGGAIAVVLALVACQSGAPAEKALTGYSKDVDRICGAMEQSGALELEEGGRAMHVGIWLARNLETQDGRELSATLVALPPQDRVAKLLSISKAEKIKECSILKTWGGA